MRAAVRDRYGPPEVVRVVEVEKPAVRDRDVLVRVRATTVNRTDCGLRAAKPWIYRLFLGLRRPRRTVLGTEFAGEIEAVGGGVATFGVGGGVATFGVGGGVATFGVGDRVFGFSGTTFGAHAEYLVMPEEGSMMAAIPEGLTFDEAAPGSEGSHYALSSIRAAKVRRGQDVLVYGATGAIGSAAVQLLKQLGATVTAVCATDQLDLVKGLGADRVIDYTAEDFTRDGHSYDVVMDAVGKSSFAAAGG